MRAGMLPRTSASGPLSARWISKFGWSQDELKPSLKAQVMHECRAFSHRRSRRIKECVAITDHVWL